MQDEGLRYPPNNERFLNSYKRLLKITRPGVVRIKNSACCVEVHGAEIADVMSGTVTNSVALFVVVSSTECSII